MADMQQSDEVRENGSPIPEQYASYVAGSFFFTWSQQKGYSNIGTKLKDAVTTLKPQRLSIVKFWQGVVDLIVRAAVAVSAV